MKRLFALVMLVFVLVGCGAAMTPAEIKANGTHTYDAPPEKVFEAATAALKAQGYEIAVAKPEKGLIKTNRKLVRADAVGNQSAVGIQRQYILTITSDGTGKTTVEAIPKVFQGEADLSDGSVWVLDGDAGERKLWSSLFTEINDNL